MKYLTSTFSPMMIKQGQFEGEKISLEKAITLAVNAKSCVGHEVTAKVLSALLKQSVAFNRENVAAVPGDSIIAIIPNFRADQAREFSHDEVKAAGFQAWLIFVWEEE